MRLSFWIALILSMVATLAWHKATAQQSGTRVCSTTTSGSISHEYCTFTPLVVQAPAVTVQPAQVTVNPQITVAPPAPKPAAAPAPKIRN